MLLHNNVSVLFTEGASSGNSCFIYILAWALSLSVQQNWAMREPSVRGTDNKVVPALFLCPDLCLVNVTNPKLLILCKIHASVLLLECIYKYDVLQFIFHRIIIGVLWSVGNSGADGASLCDIDDY